MDIGIRIAESGARSITKTGAGTLILRGSNGYTGGTTLTSGTLGLNNNAALSTGPLTINGGVLASSGASAITLANNITVGGNFALGGLGQDITINGTMDLGGATRSISLGNAATVGGVISNGGLSVFSSSATRSLTLGTTNTYSGGTTVNSGTLLVNGTSGTGSGDVTVKASATLGGTGSIAGATRVELNGIHSAGTASAGGVGKQSFGSSLTYSTGSIFAWDSATAPKDSTAGGIRGSDFDAVNADSLGATTGAIFRVVLQGSQTFAESFWDADHAWTDIFKTSDAGSLLNFQSIFSGGFQYYDVTTGLVGNTNSTGRNFTIDGSTLNWSAVPEPTSALAGLLLAGGLLCRRRF